MITINNIVKAYNRITAVDIPHLEIGQGIIGLAGNNGAGKTTLFRLLLDLIKADRGEVLSNGKDIAKFEEWKSYTAAYIDEEFLISYLTPEEYFYFVGKLHKLSKADVDEFLNNFSAFFNGTILKSGKYIRDLSKGNQFKIGIAACMLQSPEILILDEPFANLDPSSQIRLIQMMKELNKTKPMTILISSHNLNHITEVCTRILLMEKGLIIKDLQTSSETLSELEVYFRA